MHTYIFVYAKKHEPRRRMLTLAKSRACGVPDLIGRTTSVTKQAPERLLRASKGHVNPKILPCIDMKPANNIDNHYKTYVNKIVSMQRHSEPMRRSMFIKMQAPSVGERVSQHNSSRPCLKDSMEKATHLENHVCLHVCTRKSKTFMCNELWIKPWIETRI